jgi:hypothetical protein
MIYFTQISAMMNIFEWTVLYISYRRRHLFILWSLEGEARETRRFDYTFHRIPSVARNSMKSVVETYQNFERSSMSY